MVGFDIMSFGCGSDSNGQGWLILLSEGNAFQSWSWSHNAELSNDQNPWLIILPIGYSPNAKNTSLVLSSTVHRARHPESPAAHIPKTWIESFFKLGYEQLSFSVWFFDTPSTISFNDGSQPAMMGRQLVVLDLLPKTGGLEFMIAF